MPVNDVFIPATIVRPLSSRAGSGFFQSVTIDYESVKLGPVSALSRLSQTFDTLEESFPNYRLLKLDDIPAVHGGFTFALRLFTSASDSLLDDYKKYLIDIRNGTVADFAPGFSGTTALPNNGYDLWIDTTNATIFSYDRHYMAGLSSALTKSFSK